MTYAGSDSGWRDDRGGVLPVVVRTCSPRQVMEIGWIDAATGGLTWYPNNLGWAMWTRSRSRRRRPIWCRDSPATFRARHAVRPWDVGVSARAHSPTGTSFLAQDCGGYRHAGRFRAGQEEWFGPPLRPNGTGDQHRHGAVGCGCNLLARLRNRSSRPRCCARSMSGCCGSMAATHRW